MCAALAGLSISLAALAASARQQDPPAAQPEQQQQPPQDQAPAQEQPPAPEQAPAEPGQPPAPAAPATPQAEADKPYVEPALAERLYEMAQGLLRQENIPEPVWRQAAGLLAAASRLSPGDPRFPRLLVEARLKVNDTDGAIEALNAYRRIYPADRVAQIQLIDLYAGRMQTADARLSYLQDLLGRETVPDEVRSHVAAECAELLLERSQDEAEKMVGRSLELFPLNLDALRLKYEMLAPDAPAADRAGALLGLLRSNPTQPAVVNELAQVLGRVGLHKDSLEWYTVALGLFPRAGQPYPAGFVADAGTQALLGGQTQQLDALLDSYLKARPEDAGAWFLDLIKDRSEGKLDKKRIDEAYGAMAQNLAEVGRSVTAGSGSSGSDAANPAAPAAPATPAAPGAAQPPARTPPGAAPAPTTAPSINRTAAAADALAAAKRIKAGEALDWHAPLMSTLSDLAWLDLYFGEDAGAASAWVTALRELVPPDDVMLNRLDGWQDLVAGRADDARAKLQPVADRDPLAALGLVRLFPQDAGGQAAATEQATRLLQQYRTGLVGAMVWSGLRDRNIKVPDDEGAAAVREVLAKFPRDWMEINNQPEAYYEVMADVGRVAHKFHEPMYGRITLRNKTDYDITVGPDGVLRPDLWFDARVTGLVNKQFPGVAYDRVTGNVVLKARGVLQQIVRIDQGPLSELLDQNPSASAQINANVLTNPAPTASGVGPGPAGQRRAFNKSFVRSGFALSQPVARKRLLQQLQAGQPGDKIEGLDLLAGYVRLFQRQQQVEPATRALAAEFVAAIGSARDDASRPVSIWAKYLVAGITDAGRASALEALLKDDAWPARLLGVVAAGDVGGERQAQVAVKLAADDPEPLVKRYAAATAEYLKLRPATQPTTAPAGPKLDEQPVPAGGPGPSVPSAPPGR
jgi:tetratricopeptide (TPR) repeat protein